MKHHLIQDIHLSNPIIVGVVGSAYGVYGWMRVSSFTEEVKNIINYQPWYIKKYNTWQSIALEKYKWHNNKLIIKLKNIINRNVAQQLTNHKIFIEDSQLNLLAVGEYYWKDLIGCKVFTTTGYNLGNVTNIFTTKCNDILVVKNNSKYTLNIQEQLIPFILKKIIKDVNITSRIIKIMWEVTY